MQGFELTQVVPLPMAEAVLSPGSIWMNKVSIPPKNTLIIAPSGSGKTSLFAFLYGLRQNYKGTIAYNGEDISRFGLKKWSVLRKKELSAIFQDLRLIPHSTVKENLLLKNQLTGFKSETEIRQMLEQLGIEDKWNQSCGTLSFGQQQRVSIVRGLLQPYKFLLTDEPFSHIDEQNIEKAKRLMESECRLQQAALIMFSLGSHYGMNFENQMTL